MNGSDFDPLFDIHMEKKNISFLKIAKYDYSLRAINLSSPWKYSISIIDMQMSIITAISP